MTRTLIRTPVASAELAQAAISSAPPTPKRSRHQSLHSQSLRHGSVDRIGFASSILRRGMAGV